MPPAEASKADAAGGAARKGKRGEELKRESIPDFARHDVAMRAVAVEHPAEDAAFHAEILDW